MPSAPFHFKKFSIQQEGVAHPIGTDSILLGSWVPVRAPGTILDIGTGTGVLALMLAQRCPEAQIDGIEIHAPTAAVASANFNNSPWASRLQVNNTSIQAYQSQCSIRYDLIVSNPPFFAEQVLSPKMERRMGRHNSFLSPKALLDSALNLLGAQGVFALILPPQTAVLFQELGAASGLYCTAVTEVIPKAGKPVERILMQFERRPHGFERRKITLLTENGSRTAEFEAISGAFYLK